MSKTVLIALSVICFLGKIQASVASVDAYEEIHALVNINGVSQNIEWRIYDTPEPVSELELNGPAMEVYLGMKRLNQMLFRNEITTKEYLSKYFEIANPVNWPSLVNRDIAWAESQKRYVDKFYGNDGYEIVYGEFRTGKAVGFISKFSDSRKSGITWFYPDSRGRMSLDYSMTPAISELRRMLMKNGYFPDELEQKGLITITSRNRGSYSLPQKTDPAEELQSIVEPLETIEQATFSSEPERLAPQDASHLSEADVTESHGSMSKWLIVIGAVFLLSILIILLLRRRLS